MTERTSQESTIEGILVAIRILTEHVGMSTDARRRIGIAIGDVDDTAPPVPIDPRDAEIAALRAQVERNRLQPNQTLVEGPPTVGGKRRKLKGGG